MQPKKFEYLPHTADIMFAAYGRDRAEVVENAAAALLNVMLDTGKIRRSGGAQRRLKITEKADTMENLVWYVLQDILTRVDEKALGAFEFRVSSLKERNGKLETSGILSYKSKTEGCFLTEVKAVTPYGMEFRKAGKGYKMQVVLDV
jgi:SHS2 domain-containing protein